MTHLECLESTVALLRQDLAKAVEALAQFKSLPENNVFESLEKAEAHFYNLFENQAAEDCDGAHNCGSETYDQEFIVGETRYLAVASVEYNRYDKTYWYVDGYEFETRVLP